MRATELETSAAPARGTSESVDSFTRWAYGIGSVAESAKGGAFGFVPFFYSSVLGLSPALYGLAAMIAQISDAISDPVVGTLSDNTRSRY